MVRARTPIVAYTEIVRGRRALLSLIAVFTVLVAGTSLTRTVRSFYRLDFPVTWDERGLQVDGVPPGSSASAAQLSAGDLILEIDSISIDRLEDPVFVLAAGQEHRLTVTGESGESRAVMFAPPAPVIDPIYLARSAVGLFGLGCALVALWLTDRREAATFLLLAAASLIVGAVPNRIASTHQSLLIIYRMAGAALPFLMVRFFSIFPERERSMWRWDLVTVLAVVSAAVTAMLPDLDAWWQMAASILRGVFASALLYGFVLYVGRWRAAVKLARERRQIEWAALGMIVGLVPYFALVMLPQWLGIGFEPFSWLAVFPLAAVPLGFLAALTEYRLWDLEPITRDLLSATLVVVVGGFIFALTNHVLQRYSGGLGAARNLIAFATGVLLVVLLQPVRQRVERFLDQWLHHGRPAPRWLLTHSTRDLARLTDPGELLTRLAETLREGLEFDLVATYLRTGEGGFRMVTGIGEEIPGELPFGVVDQEFPDPRESALVAAGYALRVPLERVGTIHGLLYLGLRRGIFPLGTEGQEVVSTFAAQAAVALESARYLDDLRRQAEEYRILHANTQRIIESSAAAILVCDASGRILSANFEAAGIFAHDAQDLVGQELKRLVQLPEGWQVQLPLHAAKAEATTRSAPPRRVIMAVSVLELETGSFNGRVVVLQDVTELRDLQDRVREHDRLAALGRLASGLAHEINTPLTGIASFAQMLGEMTDEEDPRSTLVSKLVDQSFRVSRIVANLRAAVRGSREDRTVLELGRVVTGAAQDAARSLGALERLELGGIVEEVYVHGAPGPVELAVSNLVRNAIEASPPHANVSVEVVVEADWVLVRVRDHGPGVPEELAERVFEPFFTTKAERGGTGLGLSMTRDMIAQLGGEVGLENAPDGGAVATLRMQRCRESEAS
jgi:two-component system NtrC family sensor kinase